MMMLHSVDTLFSKRAKSPTVRGLGREVGSVDHKNYDALVYLERQKKAHTWDTNFLDFSSKFKIPPRGRKNWDVRLSSSASVGGRKGRKRFITMNRTRPEKRTKTEEWFENYCLFWDQMIAMPGHCLFNFIWNWILIWELFVFCIKKTTPDSSRIALSTHLQFYRRFFFVDSDSRSVLMRPKRSLQERGRVCVSISGENFTRHRTTTIGNYRGNKRSLFTSSYAALQKYLSSFQIDSKFLFNFFFKKTKTLFSNLIFNFYFHVFPIKLKRSTRVPGSKSTQILWKCEKQIWPKNRSGEVFCFFGFIFFFCFLCELRLRIVWVCVFQQILCARSERKVCVGCRRGERSVLLLLLQEFLDFLGLWGSWVSFVCIGKISQILLVSQWEIVFPNKNRRKISTGMSEENNVATGICVFG